jgi:hypothetical protein
MPDIALHSHWRFIHCISISGLNGVVVNIADCYPRGAGFDSRVMHGFLSDVIAQNREFQETFFTDLKKYKKNSKEE